MAFASTTGLGLAGRLVCGVRGGRSGRTGRTLFPITGQRAALFAQNAFHSLAQMSPTGAHLGLARAHNAEDAGLGVLQDFDLQLFTRRIEVAAGLLNGAIQVFALELLKPFHTNLTQATTQRGRRGTGATSESA
jgi:hypothetical protein